MLRESYSPTFLLQKFSKIIKLVPGVIITVFSDFNQFSVGTKFFVKASVRITFSAYVISLILSQTPIVCQIFGGNISKITTLVPDHPDVKNVDHTFTKVARHERVRFVGNVAVGTDVKVAELRQVSPNFSTSDSVCQKQEIFLLSEAHP
jgi:hypothetical protein